MKKMKLTFCNEKGESEVYQVSSLNELEAMFPRDCKAYNGTYTFDFGSKQTVVAIYSENGWRYIDRIWSKAWHKKMDGCSARDDDTSFGYCAANYFQDTARKGGLRWA